MLKRVYVHGALQLACDTRQLAEAVKQLPAVARMAIKRTGTGPGMGGRARRLAGIAISSSRTHSTRCSPTSATRPRRTWKRRCRAYVLEKAEIVGTDERTAQVVSRRLARGVAASQSLRRGQFQKSATLNLERAFAIGLSRATIAWPRFARSGLYHYGLDDRHIDSKMGSPGVDPFRRGSSLGPAKVQQARNDLQSRFGSGRSRPSPGRSAFAIRRGTIGLVDPQRMAMTPGYRKN